MKCKQCGNEPMNKNGHTERGVQKYRCNKCGYNTEADTPTVSPKKRTKLGMSLNRFRAEFDVDLIVQKVMEGLDPDMIYTKSEIYTLCKKTASYPGLSAAVEDQVDNYGKAGGKQFFSHKDTITALKDEGKLM